MQAIKMNKSFFLYLIIISMAVAPAIALGKGNRNLFLIGVMVLSPILILTYRKFYASDIWLLFFMLSIILVPLVNHPESFRLSTVMYSIMFGLTFLAYERLLRKGNFTIENYQNLLKYLIYAYFIVLLIQQFCVLTGLPVFNLSNYNPMEPWKLNSLAAEPSHSARIVALLMYAYITVKELVINRKYNFRKELKTDKWIWVAFLWTMLTMGSGTAFLFIGIILLKFMRAKNVLALLIIGVSIFFVVDFFGIHAFERTFDVIKATLTLDTDTIIHTDLSAAIRIVPMMILAKMADITTINGWFGYGIDYVGTFMYKLIPAVQEGFSGGGMFILWMEYGFLSFILFVIFSFLNTFRKGDYLSIVFWFMLVFMYGINSQIVWLTIILLFTNKYFFEKESKRRRKVKL
jgi:hypothetical protein